MAYQNSTPLLGLPIWQGSDYMDWEDWNGAWEKIENALADFDYIIRKYGYTFQTTRSGGVTTMTVTAKETCPIVAKLVAAIGRNNSGQTTITITTTIDQTITQEKHTLGRDNGEGGPI